MSFSADIGIIGAMAKEVDALIADIKRKRTKSISGIDFHCGLMHGKSVVVAKCGIGKVFAALCTEAMILNFAPKLIVNTGVGGALATGLVPGDIVFADALVQHDMDTSPLGDPKGLVSGINIIRFPTDERAVSLLCEIAEAHGIKYKVGTIATGDRFICDRADKERIVSEFSASACEMEGGAVAHVAFVNGTPCSVIRAISDSADGSASMDYMEFLPRAVEISYHLTTELVKKY